MSSPKSIPIASQPSVVLNEPLPSTINPDNLDLKSLLVDGDDPSWTNKRLASLIEQLGIKKGTSTFNRDQRINHINQHIERQLEAAKQAKLAKSLVEQPVPVNDGDDDSAEIELSFDEPQQPATNTIVINAKAELEAALIQIDDPRLTMSQLRGIVEREGIKAGSSKYITKPAIREYIKDHLRKVFESRQELQARQTMASLEPDKIPSEQPVPPPFVYPTEPLLETDQRTLVQLNKLIQDMGITKGSSALRTRAQKIEHINRHIKARRDLNCVDKYRCEPAKACEVEPKQQCALKETAERHAIESNVDTEVDEAGDDDNEVELDLGDSASPPPPEEIKSLNIIDDKQLYYGTEQNLRGIVASKKLLPGSYAIESIPVIAEKEAQVDEKVQKTIDEIINEQPHLQDGGIGDASSSASGPSADSIEPIEGVEIVQDTMMTPTTGSNDSAMVDAPLIPPPPTGDENVDKQLDVDPSAIPSQPIIDVEQPGSSQFDSSQFDSSQPDSSQPGIEIELEQPAAVMEQPPPQAPVSPIQRSNEVPPPPQPKHIAPATPADLRNITAIIKGKKPLTQAEARVAAMMRRCLGI